MCCDALRTHTHIVDEALCWTQRPKGTMLKILTGIMHTNHAIPSRWLSVCATLAQVQITRINWMHSQHAFLKSRPNCVFNHPIDTTWSAGESNSLGAISADLFGPSIDFGRTRECIHTSAACICTHCSVIFTDCYSGSLQKLRLVRPTVTSASVSHIGFCTRLFLGLLVWRRSIDKSEKITIEQCFSACLLFVPCACKWAAKQQFR